MATRQTDGQYDGYRDGDPLICVDCGTKKPHVEGPGEDGICASAHNGDAVCDACEDVRDVSHSLAPNADTHMTTTISASTHTAVDDGQVLWIIARPHATVLAELIAVDAADKGRDKETEDPNEAYGAYCGEHPAVAEFFNARKIRDKYDLPAVRYVTGRGWS